MLVIAHRFQRAELHLCDLPCCSAEGQHEDEHLRSGHTLTDRRCNGDKVHSTAVKKSAEWLTKKWSLLLSTTKYIYYEEWSGSIQQLQLPGAQTHGGRRMWNSTESKLCRSLLPRHCATLAPQAQRQLLKTSVMRNKCQIYWTAVKIAVFWGGLFRGQIFVSSHYVPLKQMRE